MATDPTKKHLKRLVDCLVEFDKNMDFVMHTLPTSGDRGKHIAKLLNGLSLEIQGAMHYGLGYSFNKIEKILELGKEKKYKEIDQIKYWEN